MLGSSLHFGAGAKELRGAEGLDVGAEPGKWLAATGVGMVSMLLMSSDGEAGWQEEPGDTGGAEGGAVLGSGVECLRLRLAGGGTGAAAWKVLAKCGSEAVTGGGLRTSRLAAEGLLL